MFLFIATLDNKIINTNFKTLKALKMSLILCWNTSLPEHSPYESLLCGVLKQQISDGYQIKESLPETIPTVYTTQEFSPNHFTRNLTFMKSKYGDRLNICHLLCSMSDREVHSSKLLLLESLRTGVSPLARGGSSGGSSTPS